jgi:hypothetical protein
VRPKKLDALEFQLEEQSPYSRRDAAFGRRAWAYRARAPPWRQKPEWELADDDVIDQWLIFDAAVFAHAPPVVFVELAEKTVAALGRWPRPTMLMTPCGLAHHLLERRLAACLHAVLAHPRFHGAERGSNAAVSRARIDEIWQRCLPRTNELPATAVTPCCVSDDPSQGQRVVHGLVQGNVIHGLLQAVGLGLPSVDARIVFRHQPAQNMQKAIRRFQLIRRSPLFHGMELGQTCLDNADKLYEWIIQNHRGHDQDGGAVWGPKGRLFMCQLHFDDYNRTRLAAEDPQAFRWRPEKLLVDYTFIVTAADWTDAFCDLESSERFWLERDAAWHRLPSQREA